MNFEILMEAHMLFWLFMVVMNLLIPFIMILFGRYFSHHVPKKISYIFGYRTPRSMKNMDTWTFAHEYIGNSWPRLGFALIIPSVLGMIPFLNAPMDTVAILGSVITIFQAIVLVISILFVEKALRNNFDRDGNRKHVF